MIFSCMLHTLTLGFRDGHRSMGMPVDYPTPSLVKGLKVCMPLLALLLSVCLAPSTMGGGGLPSSFR